MGSFRRCNLVRFLFLRRSRHANLQVDPQADPQADPQTGWFPSIPRPLLIVFIAVGVAGVGRSLPYLAPIRASDLVQVDEAVTVSDRHGQPLGTLLSRDQDHTMVVELDDISPVFIQAMLAAEDGRYYHHGPLDLKAMVRASYNSARAGRIVSGASTITMQLARMINPSPRTIMGKVEEVWTAWRLAAGMNRDEILAAYVNRIPMGSNIYGVEAASRVYFGVSSRDLTVAQASILAALPNNPTYLNPYYYWEVLKQRQRYVLDQMVADGWLTQEEGDRAFATELTLHPRQYGIQAAPHFLFWVAEQLPANHPSDVQTTLDRDLQQFVQTQVTQVVRSLADRNVQQGAAIVIDNHSGDVLAYVGAVDYFDHRLDGQNDGVQALRQPGSTLKPFLYGLALEQKQIRPNTILADVPTYYPIPGAQLYNPTDYDGTFQGPVRVRLALANSLNVPAVRVLEQVGVSPFLDRLRDLGFNHLDQPPDHYGLGLALGSGEVSLWELAQAYLTMAHHGRSRPLMVLRDPHSNNENLTLANSTLENPTLANSNLAIEQSIEPSKLGEESLGTATTWALVTDMLGDRHARARSFGVDSVLSLPFDAAVKTGTSSNFRDTWTVGFTTDYTVATWIGNFDGTPMNQVSGVTGAAPLWNRIMLHLHHHEEPTPLPPPSELTQRPICALSGLKPTPVCPTVVEEYFYPEDLAVYEREIDTVYQSVGETGDNGSSDRPNYRLNLPDEYDEWLAQQAAPAFPLDRLRIVSPLDGDRFLLPSSYTPDSSSSHQRLEFKIAGLQTLKDDQPVEWWLNGERLVLSDDSTVSVSPSYFWSLQPGVWTLEVRQGEEGDRVQFEVRMDDGDGWTRGFSVD